MNAYASEKITNALLCGTTPVYLGCKNIEKYFPKDVIRLSGELKYDMILLNSIISNPEKYKKEINVDEIKNTIFILRNIKNVFS